MGGKPSHLSELSPIMSYRQAGGLELACFSVDVCCAGVAVAIAVSASG